MKTIIFILFQVLPICWINGQTFQFPVAQLTDLDGFNMTSTQIFHTGQPTILVFWNSGSVNGCETLEALQTVWDSQLKEKNVRIVAICSGYDGIWSSIKPQVYGNGWEFDIYIDSNGEFSREMQINGMPFTMLFDADQKLICSYSGFCSGIDELVCEKMIQNLDEQTPPLAIAK